MVFTHTKLATISGSCWSVGEPVWSRWLAWKYFTSCDGWSWANFKWGSWWRDSRRGVILVQLLKKLNVVSSFIQSYWKHILQVETSIFAMSMKPPPSVSLELDTSSCKLDSVLPLALCICRHVQFLAWAELDMRHNFLLWLLE